MDLKKISPTYQGSDLCNTVVAYDAVEFFILIFFSRKNPLDSLGQIIGQ
jgi:hypothetical protein